LRKQFHAFKVQAESGEYYTTWAVSPAKAFNNCWWSWKRGTEEKPAGVITSGLQNDFKHLFKITDSTAFNEFHWDPKTQEWSPIL
jgi:hypothetical protein